MSRRQIFCELAGAALHNAGINADNHIRAALGAAAEHSAPAVIESNEDELMYEVTFELPDAGLVPIADNFCCPAWGRPRRYPRRPHCC